MSCVIYATGRRHVDVDPRVYTPVFQRPDQARAWFKAFINDQPHEFITDDTIKLTTDFDIHLRSEQWHTIIAADARCSAVDSHTLALIGRFKHGYWEERPVIHARHDEVAPHREKHALRPERAPRVSCPPGFVTISTLCAASAILPTHARAALRASGRIKPAFGWAFDPSEIPAIKALIGLPS